MSETPLVEPGKGRGVLAAGGIAAILASACCLGPLLLVALGFSGAWIGNLTVLEPYRPIFIGAALIESLVLYTLFIGIVLLYANPFMKYFVK